MRSDEAGAGGILRQGRAHRLQRLGLEAGAAQQRADQGIVVFQRLEAGGRNQRRQPALEVAGMEREDVFVIAQQRAVVVPLDMQLRHQRVRTERAQEGFARTRKGGVAGLVGLAEHDGAGIRGGTGDLEQGLADGQGAAGQRQLGFRLDRDAPRLVFLGPGAGGAGLVQHGALHVHPAQQGLP